MPLPCRELCQGPASCAVNPKVGPSPGSARQLPTCHILLQAPWTITAPSTECSDVSQRCAFDQAVALGWNTPSTVPQAWLTLCQTPPLAISQPAGRGNLCIYTTISSYFLMNQCFPLSSRGLEVVGPLISPLCSVVQIFNKQGLRPHEARRGRAEAAWAGTQGLQGWNAVHVQCGWGGSSSSLCRGLAAAAAL